MKWLRYNLLVLVTLLLTVSLVPTMPTNAAEPLRIPGEEIVEQRTETSKTYWVDEGTRRLELHVGPIHYKDDYSDPNEPWKDIDTTIVGGRVTKAPYDLTIDTVSKSFAVVNKRTGETTTIALSSISEKAAPQVQTTLSSAKPTTLGNTVTWSNVVNGVDLVITAGGDWVRFSRIIQSEYVPQLGTFIVDGKNVVYRAHDKNAEPIEVLTTKIGNKVTESFVASADRYPITIDPTWQVSASTDDAGGRLSDGYYNNAWTVNPAGGTTTTWTYYSGMRFLNINIINAATIASAKITFTAGIQGFSGVETRTRFSAEDTDDAATFSTVSDFTTRWNSRTAARVDWDSPALTSWVVDTEYDSPELKTIIQEIIDRGGWATGQDIAIFWGDREDRSNHAAGNRRYAYTWDSDSSKAPVLSITVAGAPTVVTNDATGISGSAGTFNGDVTVIGDTIINERGFDWDTDSGAPYASNWTEVGTFGTGAFSHEITGLSPGATIYFRAKAKNDTEIWGYGAEKALITLSDAPTNFTVTSLGGSLVGINWTKATGADTTLIIGKSGSYPTSKEDGWVAYNSTAESTTDSRGFSFDLENPYWRAWSYHTGGFSTDYAEATLGGDGMNNLTLFLVFVGILGMGSLWLAVSRRPRNMLLSTFSFLAWMGIGFWWMNDSALDIFGTTNAWINIMYYIPFVAAFAVMLDLIFNIDKVVVTRTAVGGGRNDTFTDLENRSALNPPESGYNKHKRLLREQRK